MTEETDLEFKPCLRNHICGTCKQTIMAGTLCQAYVEEGIIVLVHEVCQHKRRPLDWKVPSSLFVIND